MVSQPSWSWDHSATVPSAARLAVDLERVQVEGRAYRPEAEGGDIGARRVASQQVQQQRGEQRPVDDETGVALDLGDVAAVVVDAVPVEGQRRVAEQQDVVRDDRALPRGTGRRGRGRRFDLAGLLLRPVDDVVVLHQGRVARAVAAHLVPHRDEDERTRPSLLGNDVLDGRRPDDVVTDAQRAAEVEPTTGPHPARQRNRREEPTALGMPVGPEFGLPVHRQEVEPVPEGRQRGAGRDGLDRVVQRRVQRGDRGRCHDVGRRLRAPDPRRQVDLVASPVRRHGRLPPRRVVRLTTPSLSTDRVKHHHESAQGCEASLQAADRASGLLSPGRRTCRSRRGACGTPPPRACRRGPCDDPRAPGGPAPCHPTR